VTLDVQKNAGTSEVETSKRVLAGSRRCAAPTGRPVLDLDVQSTYTEQQLPG